MKKVTILSALIPFLVFQAEAFEKSSPKEFTKNTAHKPELRKAANIRFDCDKNGITEGWKRVPAPYFFPEPASVLDTGDVIHTVPAPASRCQGLTYDGSSLWVSDYQTDLIYEVSPVDGTVLNSFASPGEYVEGLAWDGSYLWAADNGGGSSSPDMVYKIDPSSGSTVYSFEPPNNWAHGITWDGQNLWMDDFDAKTLDKVDPVTGQLLLQLNAPGNYSIGLTWDGEFLWSNDFNADSLYRIDPVTGDVVAQVVAPHTNPRDMAWDGQYIWVLSWVSSTIYQVEVGAAPTSADNEPGIPQKFQLLQNYPNPFNATTIIHFEIAKKSDVILTVYDILGREVTKIVNETKQPGYYDIKFDAPGLSSGTYFYRLKAGDMVETKRMVLLK